MNSRLSLSRSDVLELTSSPSAVDVPILDLSCKKETPICSVKGTHSDRHSLPLDAPKFHPGQIQSSFSEEEKSGFETRTFMVTPPSDTDSPRKPRYQQLPELVHHRLLPINLGVAPVLPSLLGSVNEGTIKLIPVALNSKDNCVTQDSAICPDNAKKAPRPFKAYPKDPLTMTMGPELIYDSNSNGAYSEFRKKMLESVKKTNEGTNIKMRRISKSPVLPTSTVDDKDAAYWERRRKNNEAAKRSRDARRAKEDEIAIRAAFLEQENMKLKCEVVALRNETAKLRCMVYSN